MKYVIIFILAVLFLLGIIYSSHFKLVDVSGKKFIADLALTEKEHRAGLSRRKSLSRNRAMLFVFEGKNRRAFWMKDMEFDLDLIWIDGSEIVHIEKNFSHLSQESVFPEPKADKVLEINAGLSDEYGFGIGDTVKIY